MPLTSHIEKETPMKALEGQTGPMRNEPGFDMVAQGYSGIMSLCGQTGDDYQRVGISIGDINAGLHAYMAIATALYAREKTGKGTYIDDWQVRLGG